MVSGDRPKSVILYRRGMKRRSPVARKQVTILLFYFSRRGVVRTLRIHACIITAMAHCVKRFGYRPDWTRQGGWSLPDKGNYALAGGVSPESPHLLGAVAAIPCGKYLLAGQAHLLADLCRQLVNED